MLQLNNFLDHETHQNLIDLVSSRESDFVGTTTATNAPNYRESLVLHSFPEYFDYMVGKIKHLLPDICSKLAIAPFEPTQVECQITAHNDGHYYRVHTDNGSPEVVRRVLTYVYYFYREPRKFSGGYLRLYNADSHQDIEPRNNSIVFFPSGLSHEVLPVSCPSGQFLDSRFTVNGWVRR